MGGFKSHIELAWIVHCLKWAMLSISLQRISPLLGPRPWRFYACVPSCKSECTLSRVDRAFIYSTLKACRWLAVSALTSLHWSVSLHLPCSLFHISARNVSMRNRHPCLWPFDRQTVGNRTSEDRKRQRGRRNKSEWCPRRVNAMLPHWESCGVELNDHAWMNSGRLKLCSGGDDGGGMKCCTESELWHRRNRLFCLFYHSHLIPPFFTHCFFFCGNRWRETSSYSQCHYSSIWLSLSAFSGGLFYSFINWDLTPLPRLHLSISLHDNQLTHVQTPSGKTPLLL